MQLGVIGLGRMGAGIVRRLLHGGHECVVFNRTQEKMKPLADAGAVATTSLDEFVACLRKPRAAWVMVTAGQPTEDMIHELANRMEPDDILIDGGNSHYKDDIRRARELAGKGIRYLDVGTSGGIWGRERGYCLMVGGDAAAAGHLGPLFQTLAPGRDAAGPTPGREGRTRTAEDGYLHCGPAGAGHFVKMVHNGIEYGLMQAYAEGFDILRNAAGDGLPPGNRYDFDLPEIAELWRRGSVVGSWLLDLTAIALAQSPELADYTGFVQDSGEGRWTIQAAVEEGVPADVLSAALFTRFRSRQEHTFAEKVLSAMRHQFGGHTEARPTDG